VITTVEVGGQTVTLGRHLDAAARHDARSLAWPAEASRELRTVEHEHHAALDQGEIGACAGYAAAACLLLGSDEALALYERATRLDPYPGVWPPDDTGSDGTSVAKAARALGYARSYRWAFGLPHVLRALVLRRLIVGVPWTEGMMTPDADGMLEATGETIGGHEVCLVGIDVGAETVTVLNSWGPTWGDQGTARMRWSTLGGLLRRGGDATVLLP